MRILQLGEFVVANHLVANLVPQAAALFRCYSVLFGLQVSIPLAWAAQDNFDANTTVVPLDWTRSTRGMDGLRKFEGSAQSVRLSGVFLSRT